MMLWIVEVVFQTFSFSGDSNVSQKGLGNTFPTLTCQRTWHKRSHDQIPSRKKVPCFRTEEETSFNQKKKSSRITPYKPHTIQKKHLQMETVLCQKLGFILRKTVIETQWCTHWRSLKSFRPRIEPTTFLLWGDSANQWSLVTTMKL